MLRIIQLLASNVEYSIDDLMERLDMSRRTVYHYLDTFKEAGLPMFIEIPEGDELRNFLKEHATYIINDIGL